MATVVLPNTDGIYGAGGATECHDTRKCGLQPLHRFRNKMSGSAAWQKPLRTSQTMRSEVRECPGAQVGQLFMSIRMRLFFAELAAITSNRDKNNTLSL